MSIVSIRLAPGEGYDSKVALARAYFACLKAVSVLSLPTKALGLLFSTSWSRESTEVMVGRKQWYYIPIPGNFHSYLMVVGLGKFFIASTLLFSGVRPWAEI